jgi:allophanate hydrolase subunit 1
MDNELDSSYDIWTINQQLDDNLPYTLEYIVNTMNNLTVVYQRDIASNINIQDNLSNDYELIVNNNYENGYNEIFLRNKNLL